MIESMHQYMRVGIVHFMAFPETGGGEGPVLESIKRIAADDYFTAIEVAWIKDQEVRRKVAKLLQSAKMKVVYVGHPRLFSAALNINHLDEGARQKAVSALKEGIDEAYAMGATGFAFVSGKYAEQTKEDAYQALVASTKELCAYAKVLGDLQIILEVFDYDVDKKSLIGPAMLAKRFAEEIRKNYDNFGLMVDMGHIPLIRESFAEAILPIKDYLVHAHLGNAVTQPGAEGYGDLHPRFGFPNGVNDVSQLVEFLWILKEVNFLNPENPPIVSFEIKPFKDEDPEIVIANAKRTLNEAWARL